MNESFKETYLRDGQLEKYSMEELSEIFDDVDCFLSSMSTAHDALTGFEKGTDNGWELKDNDAYILMCLKNVDELIDKELWDFIIEYYPEERVRMTEYDFMSKQFIKDNCFFNSASGYELIGSLGEE